MMKLISITLLLGVLFSCSSFQAGNKVSTSDNMKSVSTIAFHNNVLFVGDSESASIHAYELKDSSFTSQKNVDIGRAQTFEGSILVKNINKKLADLMGSELADVKIRDMAVHKASQQVFLAVETAGSDNQPSIFKVNNGKIEHLNLSQYKHSSFKLNEKPKSSSKLEFGQKEKELTITDIDYHKGEIFVSGLGSGTFASKIRRIKYPFTGNSQTASVEIWHGIL